MNNLSDKQLRQLIREALTKHEACCLARMSPMYSIEIQNRRLYGKKDDRKALVKSLANIIQNRAKINGKDWAAMKSDWDIMLQSYDKDVEQRYEELEACRASQEGHLGRDEVDACSAGEEYEEDKEEDYYSTSSDPTMALPIDERSIKHMIREALTKTDETAIKKMIAHELTTSYSDITKNVKKVVEAELTKAFKTKDLKDDITDITKKVMKRLYKDLSYHHPYIIDRIKV
jgi:hypothetical protein